MFQVGGGCELRSASGRCVCSGTARTPCLGKQCGNRESAVEWGHGGSGDNSLADYRLCPCTLVTGADRQAATFTESEKQDSPWTPQGLHSALRDLGRTIPYKRRLVTYAKKDDITNNQVT